MQVPENLRRDLSYALWAELQRKLLPGESVALSLPGCIGEAFVLTDKRAIILREIPDAVPAACNVIAYSLGDVLGATTGAHASGGYLDLQLREPPESPEDARLYFGLADAERFAEAAKLLSSLSAQTPERIEVLMDQSGAAGNEAVGSGDPRTAVAVKCPECGTTADRFSVFCQGCGAQIRPLCAHCGGPGLPGAKFCPSCGKGFEEFIPKCPACESRIAIREVYCTQCGQVLHQRCAVCGSDVSPGWKRCAVCGRLLGSPELDPRTVRSVQNRVDQIREAQKAEAGADSEPPSIPPYQGGGEEPSTAEEYNARGLEYYNDEQYEDAIGLFRKAVAADPGNASYHCNLALAYDESDQDDLALLEYRRTLELDPNDTTALISLGYMYNEHEEPEKAKSMWQRVLEIAPGTAEAQEARDNIRHLGEL